MMRLSKAAGRSFAARAASASAPPAVPRRGAAAAAAWRPDDETVPPRRRSAAAAAASAATASRAAMVPLGVPLESDLLVIGCGIAGASAALKAAMAGLRVTMLSSAADIKDCNSYWAQGGIIYRSEDDRPELLAADVHAAGAGVCDDDAVMALATAGPRRVEEMLLGVAKVPFDRDAATGALSLCLEASHSKARIIHWRDETGKAITTAIQAAAAAHPLITVVPRATAVDLALAEGDGWELYGAGWEADHGRELGDRRCLGPRPGVRCVGAHVLLGGADSGGGDALTTLRASATMLATGGLGEIYAHTSNPESARGDGYAMALRAGAAMRNMEYVQFHPTTLHLPGRRSFLLTEALRGEGARLLDRRGRAFARDYHPAGELAPRDVVSRMIVAEMRRGGEPNALLDISHRDGDWLRKRFPAIHAHCLAAGLDLTREALPVVPAAHYFCGGVATDLHGQTTLPGLFAAGEVACTGLHGGNRLASTSLLEGLVWGCASVDHLMAPPANAAKGGNGGGVASGGGRRIEMLERRAARASAIPFEHGGSGPADTELAAATWRAVKDTMWEGVGVVRTREGLRGALRAFDGLMGAANQVFWRAAPTPETAGLRNAVDTAALVTQAAAANPRSRGAHYVEDGAEEHEEEEEEEREMAAAGGGARRKQAYAASG